MKTKKKSKFLTFCFSLFPGAAEMYMGFMKTGLSLMFLFVMLIIVTTWMNLGALPAICIVIWFYGFFHANHLASLTDEEFEQVKDGYLFGLDELPTLKNVVAKYNKWVAFFLIFLGVCLLLDTCASFLSNILPDGYRFISRLMWRIGDYLPRALIGIGIIYMGLRMINGKKTGCEPLESIEEAERGRQQQGNSEPMGSIGQDKWNEGENSTGRTGLLCDKGEEEVIQESGTQEEQ